MAIALKRADPSITVVGVQVDSCAPYANQPVAGGAITTLADGIAVKRPGRITRPLVDAWVDDIVTVGEDDVADAMMFLMERAKLFVEGGGAVGVAALMSERVAPARSGVTAVVLSGGNVDLGVLPGLIRRAETLAGRRLLLFVRITDRPGGLARLLAVISEAKANVIEVEHVREGVDLHVRETGDPRGHGGPQPRARRAHRGRGPRRRLRRQRARPPLNRRPPPPPRPQPASPAIPFWSRTSRRWAAGSRPER